MPHTCTLCRHPERAVIEGELLAGQPLRNIAEQSGTSPQSLLRHRDHVPQHLAKAHEAEQVAAADDLLAKVQGLEVDARRIAKAAEDSADLRTALAGIRELTRIVELVAKMRGEFQEGSTVNVTVAPEWLALRSRVLDALAPYPEARKAVVEALSG